MDTPPFCPKTKQVDVSTLSATAKRNLALEQAQAWNKRLESWLRVYHRSRFGCRIFGLAMKAGFQAEEFAYKWRKWGGLPLHVKRKPIDEILNDKPTATET